MGAMRLAAATLLLLPGVSVTAEAEPHGVGPADAKAYEQTITERFKCLDASKDVAFSAINDDFCDCPDGSDEPGTAACAGTDSGRAAQVFFYCQNRGSRPRYVYRSRVQDGICDCCDGSDETSSSGKAEACPNFCDEENRPFREAQERVLAEWRRALDLQVSYAEAAEKNSTVLQQELDALIAEIPKMKVKKDSLARYVTWADKHLVEEVKMAEFHRLKKIESQDGYDALMKEMRKSKLLGLSTLNTTTTTTLPSHEAPEVREAFKAVLVAAEEVSLANFHVQDLEARLDSQLLTEHASLANLSGCVTHTSSEEAEDAFFTTKYQICFFREAAFASDKKEKYSMDDIEGGGVSISDATSAGALQCDAPRAQTCTHARAHALRTELNSTVLEWCDIIQRMMSCVKEYQCCGNTAMVQQMDRDPNQRRVREQCPGFHNPCLRTSLGHWAGWTFNGKKAPHAEFANGSVCTADPAQKNALVVKFVCGAKVRVKAVVETEACRFEAAVIHPAACVASLAPKEPGPRLDKFNENAGIKTELEAKVRLNATDWHDEHDHWKNEMSRAEKEAEGKTAEYDAVLKKDHASGTQSKRVSEFAKWMDSDNLETTTTTTTEDPLADQGDEFDKIRRELRRCKIEAPIAEKAFFDAKWRQKLLETMLRPDFTGMRWAFADLEGKCMEFQADTFHFKVCFFAQSIRTAGDDEINMGRFLQWNFTDSQPRAEFGRGDPCGFTKKWGTQVTFHCGTDLEILSVETSVGNCLTEIEARHPAGCDANVPPELPPMPTAPRAHDEL